MRKASHAGKAVEHRFKHVHSAEMDIFTDVGTCNNKFLHYVPNGDEILAKKAIGKKQFRTGKKNKQMAWDHTAKTENAEYMCKRLGNRTEWVMQVWPMNKMAQMEEKMYYVQKDC